MLSLGLGLGQRFVLLIGDEGAILLRVAGNTVRERCFAPSAEPEDRVEMEAMLAEAPRIPLLLLVDVLEQSFVKDTIPPVGMIDEAGVLQRKLRTTFPDARIRGARFVGRDTRSTRKDKEFLFVSVPETKVIAAWLQWARDVRNPVQAIALLPLESLSLATRLSENLHERADRPEWVVLVTRHRTGGFRQIVVHKGQLVFSRLTQSLPPDATPGEIAATLDREHKLTMGYLRRMSYNEEQGLDIIVVEQPEVEAELLALGMPPSQLKVITPHDVAVMFKLRGIADPLDSYGEILHGAWVCQRRSPVLALMPEEIVHHRIGLMTTRAGYLSTIGVIGWLSYSLVTALLNQFDLQARFDALAAESIELTTELNHAIQIRGGYSVSAPEVTDTIELFDQLEAEVPSPMPILAVLAANLPQNVRGTQLSWSVSQSMAQGNQIQLVISFEILDADGDVEAAMAVSDTLAAQIAELLPNLEVEVTGPPLDVLPTQSLQGQLDLSTVARDTEEQLFTTEITVRLPQAVEGEEGQSS